MSAITLPPLPDDQASLYVGLTRAECLGIAQAADRLPGTWWVQCDKDDCGHVSVGLMLDDDGTDDDAALVFLLWRQEGLLGLGYGQGELYADLGVHSDVQAAMDAVQHVLGGFVSAGQCAEGERRSRAGFQGGRDVTHVHHPASHAAQRRAIYLPSVHL